MQSDLDLNPSRPPRQLVVFEFGELTDLRMSGMAMSAICKEALPIAAVFSAWVISASPICDHAVVCASEGHRIAAA
jgi:hypothetical protein